MTLPSTSSRTTTQVVLSQTRKKPTPAWQEKVSSARTLHLPSYTLAGVLELTHNHGTENDPGFKYSNGNSDPGRGYGHIAITVDDVEKACDRLEKLGVPFQKKPNDGKMKGIAFVLDPDG